MSATKWNLHIPSRTPFNRTIVVVIDALRFDFVVNTTETTSAYYHNKFPIIQELHSNHPENSVLFQFRADPPTTTTQRIKGIMTGSLPTFIDAGSSFTSSAVGEDNLLYHIKHKYPLLYMLGDETWVQLFPDIFDDAERTFDSDSFKMMDLDSVDNDILSHLWPILEEDNWQMMIAHFLGVDHCGHTHGPSHPNMERKLHQMNDVIEHIIPYVDDNTLLVIMGDHGMSTDGDHGGESIEELTSTLFLHSGRPLTMAHSDYYSHFYQRIHQKRYAKLGYDISAISDRLSYNASDYTVVAQIHLVPTLAYLLQIPIPFGNLGAIIPNVVYQDISDNSRVNNLVHMAEQFRLNALQVHDYITEYSQRTQQLDFASSKIQSLTTPLHHADDIMHSLWTHPHFISLLEDDTTDDYLYFQHQLEDAILEYDAFLIDTIKYCEAIWAQFDTGSMLLGILMLVLSTLSSFWLMKAHASINIMRAIVIGTITMATGSYCVYMVYSTSQEYFLTEGLFDKMDLSDWVLAICALSVCVVSFSISSPRDAPVSVLRYSSDWYLLVLVITIQSFTLGSNSFVIWEDRISRFVLMTLCLCWCSREVRCLNKYTLSDVCHCLLSPFMFMCIVRAMGVTGLCREEQFPDCSYLNGTLLSFDSLSDASMVSVFLVFMLGLVTLTSHFLRSRAGALVTFFYQLCGLIVIMKMTEDIYQNSHSVGLGLDPTSSELAFKILDVFLPRVVYVLCITGSLYSLHKWINNRSSFKAISRMGWSYMMLWSTTLAILQRPFGAAIVLCSPWLIYLLSSGHSSSLLFRLIILQTYGHNLFFVTGHQVTFTALPWKAAFVGFDDMNYYGGMILVTLSTIAGYIIAWIGWLILLSESHRAEGISQEDTCVSIQLMTTSQSIPTFLCAIFIYILRRHLMTWKIFAPRFLFQVLLEVGSHIAAILFEGILIKS